MNNDSSLSHSRWECKYHVVWIPKYRRKTLYGELRQYLGHSARVKNSFYNIEEGTKKTI
jgi:putative transposase